MRYMHTNNRSKKSLKNMQSQSKDISVTKFLVPK